MRLRRSRLDEEGIRRRHCGRGWLYLAPSGERVSDPEVLERIRSLAIPPAWRDVWICPHPDGHIQAVGTDDAGRRQYLYHDAWRTSRDAEKHERILRLALRLPRMRTEVERDLTAQGLTRERALAAGLRMLDQGLFRSGGEEYADENGTRGVATLLRADVAVRSGSVAFAFLAKGGQDRRLVLPDPILAHTVTALRRARCDSDRLLVYRTIGGWGEVTAADLNDRFRELTGTDGTVKDLRTWHATVLAAVCFADAGAPASRRARTRVERSVMAEVAEHLGNTAAVARRSYVDPRVAEKYGAGRTIARTLARLPDSPLADAASREAVERAVRRLLAGS